MSDTPKFDKPKVTLHVTFNVREPAKYSDTSLLNIYITDEPIPPDADPVKYIVARLTEEIKRQAPLLRAQYVVPGESDEVTV